VKHDVMAAMIFSVVGGAVAQLLMKVGLQEISLASATALAESILRAPKAALFVLFGLSIYITALVSWVYALKQKELNAAFPVLSLSYVLVYLMAAVWPGLDEAITLQKTAGIALITFGVWFASSPVAD